MNIRNKVHTAIPIEAVKRKCRNIARSLLTASLALLIAVSVPAYTLANADSLSTLKNKYSELQKEQQELQQQLNGLNSKVSAASEKKAAIDKNVGLIKQQIAVLNKQITTLNAQVTEKNNDLTSTQQSIDSDIKQYKDRICAIYEAGNISKLEILLSSKSVSEFLMRYETIQVISDHDNKIINDLKKDEETLKADKAELEKSLASLQNSQGSLAAKKKLLESELAQQEKIVAELQNSVDSTKQESDEVEQKARETDAQINAEIAKQAAARKRELEEKAKKRSGGSGTASSVSGNYLVSYAEGLVGTPYVFGSADPSGFDCSGFVQYVYANAAGVALTHSAAAQSGYGTAVASDNLQPGDLVFFATGGGSINHVGIYIGNDQFVAANTGSAMAVTINSLFSSSYWSGYYVCARRILD